MKATRIILLVILLGLSGLIRIEAQQLDLSDPGVKKAYSKKVLPAAKAPPINSNANSKVAQPASAFYAGAGAEKPLTVTVTKTRYLPLAMYGQWSLVGTLISSNDGESPPTTTDIWILDRHGDDVVITNPANGAMAIVNVTDVHDNSATIYRQLSAPRGFESDETIEMRVNGDLLTGKEVRKIRKIRNGVAVKEYFSLYQFQAQRISGARTIFKPQAMDGPDIKIEEVQTVQSKN